MPLKVGYSILILPYPTRFSTLFLLSSLRSTPPFNPRFALSYRDSGLLSPTTLNPTTAAESLHCDFSRDTSSTSSTHRSRDPFSALCGKALDVSLLESPGKRSNRRFSPAFDLCVRQVTDILAFRLLASSPHNGPRLSRVPSRVSRAAIAQNG